jgi:hypothetical protein
MMEEWPFWPSLPFVCLEVVELEPCSGGSRGASVSYHSPGDMNNGCAHDTRLFIQEFFSVRQGDDAVIVSVSII